MHMHPWFVRHRCATNAAAAMWKNISFTDYFNGSKIRCFCTLSVNVGAI